MYFLKLSMAWQLSLPTILAYLVSSSPHSSSLAARYALVPIKKILLYEHFGGRVSPRVSWDAKF